MARQQVVLSPKLIRFTRTAMEMTQKEFGDFLGVEENTVYRWEAGIHLPVGKKKAEILRRHATAERNARLASFEAPDAKADLARQEIDDLYPVAIERTRIEEEDARDQAGWD